LVRHDEISAVQPVIHPDDAGLFEAAVAGLDLLPAVPGGASRQASVRAGLEALEPRSPDLVLVHDAARPFASAALIARAIAAARKAVRRSRSSRSLTPSRPWILRHRHRHHQPREFAHGADAASLSFAVLGPSACESSQPEDFATTLRSPNGPAWR
jgi:hypothetical protein